MTMTDNPQGPVRVVPDDIGDRDPQEYDQAHGEYDGTSCEFCGRERVMIGGATGKRICEKCGSYQSAAASAPPVPLADGGR